MRALLTMVGVMLVAFISGIILWILKPFNASALRTRIQIKAYKLILRIWGISLDIRGELAPAPTLLVSNHCSYIDVFILGSLGQMRFTPKSDVKSWPVFGQISQAFDVIFVDRTRAKAKESQDKLMQAFDNGDRICVFPEGTTNDGRSLKEFKPTLFSLAEQREGLTVQPIALRYESLDGQLVTGKLWEKIAWYGDATLFPHLWAFCKARDVRVTIECLPTHVIDETNNRKILAKQTREIILSHLPHITESA